MRKKSIIVIFSLYPLLANPQNIPGLTGKFSFSNGKAINEVTHQPAKAVGAMPAEDRFGNAASAYYLNGGYGSYLNLGTGNGLKPEVGSISLWVKMENPMWSGQGYEYNPFLLTKCQAGDDFFEGYSMGYDLNTRRMGATCTLSELNQVSLRTHDAVSRGDWHHLVMTYDDDRLCFYFDGEEQGRISKNFRTHFLEGDSVMVGNSANTKNKRFFNGYIDDIAFYNRVLTPAEVKKLYEAPDPNRLHAAARWIGIGLAAAAGISLLIVAATYKYKKALREEKEKLAREKERSHMQRQMYEMEMRVIKAQMNPHFIFNSMNSVQQFILKGDNEHAAEYLVKFSRLLRKILESNADDHISLDNEIEVLTTYIELEALRFNRAFSYEIARDVRLMTSPVNIPQMLIQPVVENAIWHGLLPKKDDGMLSLYFEYLDEDRLVCTVDDNGVGRQRAPKPATTDKGKSLAMQFIYQRLELMQKEWGGRYSMTVTDKKNELGENAGTQVTMIIPIIKL